MKKNVLKINLFLAFFLLVGTIIFKGNLVVSATENGNQTPSESLDELIAELPEVTDALGTSYYYYVQLTDCEKAIYWKLQEATWDSPHVTITGVDGYTEEELYSMQYRAMSALLADKPMLTLYWQDYNQIELSQDGDSFTINLNSHYIESEYLVEKSMARIEDIVAMVGPEGDRYMRFRDLIEWMINETEYDPYYVFGTNITLDVYDLSPIGILTKNIAICDGYADTVKILCDELEIPCIIVGNAGHAWNMVQMEDNNWYLVDATASELHYQLIGNTSVEYIYNSNYAISDMYLRKEGDFIFPELSANTYEYAEEYTPQYHDIDSSFVEPDATFVYEINEDGQTCTIIGYEGKEQGDLIIPSVIDGYTVTAIGDSAFFACKGFTGDIVIPDTVTVIDQCAFYYCDGVKGELILSDKLEEIRPHAFVGCDKLSGALNLPETLKKIGRTAFYQCKSLTGDLILPSGIEEIGVEAFSGCSGLDGKFYLPDGLEWSSGMVAGTNLSEIQISNTNALYKISDGVLYSYDMKTLLACAPGKKGSLIVPEGVEKIASLACYRCEKLDGQLVLPSTLKIIERFAFQQTAFLGDLKIPDSVVTIEEGAFSGAGFTGTLTLSKNLEVIEESTFFACGFVGDLVIPNSVVDIGASAFFGVRFSGVLQMSENIQHIGGYAIGAEFTSTLDLSNSDVVLEENAFYGTWFSDYACNCGEEYIISSQEAATDTTDGYIKSNCPHCKGGKHKIISIANGLKKASDGKWYYYTNGIVDITFTGLAQNEYGWWYVKNGELDRTYTGLGKNNYGWWYVKEGKVDLTYTGMAKNENGWFYVKKGKLDLTYTGLAENEHGTWYMVNGKVASNVSGLTKISKKWMYL